jgi:small subunit ribosomal protein S20
LANHKSALKRARQSEDRNIRNRAIKSRVKSVVKELRTAAAQSANEDLTTSLNSAKSVIDKAAKKGCIHPNTAARKISRISRLLNSVTNP